MKDPERVSGASTCNYPSHYIIMTSSNIFSKLNIYNYLKPYITGLTVNSIIAGNQGKHIIKGS